MNTLNIELENCYGIKKLKTSLDFSSSPKAYAIYAPNGLMKSSLAQTFRDVAEGAASRDRIFLARACTRKITDENGADLPRECVYVIAPYDEVFGHTEKTSTLLVDSKLRQEYEQLHVDIDKAKDEFLKALKLQSGTKRDIEAEISSTFTKRIDEFYRALMRIKDEVLAQAECTVPVKAAPKRGFHCPVTRDVRFDR